MQAGSSLSGAIFIYPLCFFPLQEGGSDFRPVISVNAVSLLSFTGNFI